VVRSALTGAPVIELCVDAVLFDCDGVLVDSLASVERCWSAWAERVGLDPAAVLPHIHGRRAIESIRALAPGCNAAAEERWLEEAETGAAGETTAMPGAVELVATLGARPWAVATSGSTRLATARLTAAGLPVPAVLIGADVVGRGKPDPEPYQRAAEGLGVDPAECVVFEDTPAGMAAGMAAGAAVVGIGVSVEGVTAWVPDLTSVRVDGPAAAPFRLVVG
jgi:mannitol-1-/sugar-/sorbitol-6-phosphatase